MLEIEEKYLDKITECIYNVLKGRNVDKIILPEAFPENELWQLVTYFNRFIAEFIQLQEFIYSLSRGELDFIPPPGKMRILQSFKSLQASLKHLTWKTQQIAGGDFDQKVDFMGDFSEAFNEMTRQLKEAFAEIEQKNNTLKHQNDRITESLHYARRIQNALLPTDEYLQEKLKSVVVFYRPKDIVSGDFYWCARVGDEVILAVADCTGHGVPGSFITVMGNTFLNKIVIEEQKTDPAEILFALNQEVKNVLRQEDDKFDIKKDQADGMDVCLVTFRRKDILFAGAKRPLYITGPAGGNKLTRVKGDNISIGGRQKKVVQFNVTRLDMSDINMLYLTTDGFIDQNNEEGKKFGSKKFAELLEKISPKSNAEQYRCLDTVLREHMQGEPQRDDIAIVGVRVVAP